MAVGRTKQVLKNDLRVLVEKNLKAKQELRECVEKLVEIMTVPVVEWREIP